MIGGSIYDDSKFLHGLLEWLVGDRLFSGGSSSYTGVAHEKKDGGLALVSKL